MTIHLVWKPILPIRGGEEFTNTKGASKPADGDIQDAGAKACVGIVTQDEYLAALEGLSIFDGR